MSKTDSRRCSQRVQLILRIPEFEEPAADGIQRLRKLLKALIRSYGLRCESVEPLSEEEANEAEA